MINLEFDNSCYDDNQKEHLDPFVSFLNRKITPLKNKYDGNRVNE